MSILFRLEKNESHVRIQWTEYKAAFRSQCRAQQCNSWRDLECCVIEMMDKQEIAEVSHDKYLESLNTLCDSDEWYSSANLKSILKVSGGIGGGLRNIRV